jgi:glycosyltransferase involved in cell wall biosynthesis
VIASSLLELARLCIGCAAYPVGTDSADQAAWNLYRGLRKVADVVDIGISPAVGQDVLCDAVLLIDCVVPVPDPFFVYLHDGKDLEIGGDSASLNRASGVFTESEWRARVLARQSGISRDKVHVIPPARLGRGDRVPWAVQERRARRCSVLYVHCDAVASRGPVGGPLAPAALEVLCRDYDREIALTVIGPERIDEVGDLLQRHDLLVVAPPGGGRSGAVIVEALVRGVPCVAPAGCEMAAAIVPGAGDIVTDRVDASQLAAVIAAALADDGMHRSCRERAPAMAAYFSWERVARQVTRVISREVGLIP